MISPDSRLGVARSAVSAVTAPLSGNGLGSTREARAGGAGSS